MKSMATGELPTAAMNLNELGLSEELTTCFAQLWPV
jgi:hypothetical protein